MERIHCFWCSWAIGYGDGCNGAKLAVVSVAEACSHPLVVFIPVVIISVWLALTILAAGERIELLFNYIECVTSRQL